MRMMYMYVNFVCDGGKVSNYLHMLSGHVLYLRIEYLRSVEPRHLLGFSSDCSLIQ